ncbi:hypothetical protein AMAG_20004 [Allomyces macrogynus ATCC 38327]|uniref:Uncharacterized protein n=1 Tax=Allomyces macrogynus (strain ATCC 38327) TaxID=578462 RepID=A0A0L0T4E1_ALLM3|nr:hypothetical protein AMAG_20004 [Allomyces macrogynus ATCC 38327]|eukprot:KNE69602.1 hypothetical protein AMAG_20004 [Allomyces macrogynus ATCC 38327]
MPSATARSTVATSCTENESTQSTNPSATVRNSFAVHAPRVSSTGVAVLSSNSAASVESSTQAAPSANAWNTGSDHVSAEAEAIDRALTTASTAHKAFIFQLLGHETNRDGRKSLVALTKTLARANLETALELDRSGDCAANLGQALAAWRMEHARALVSSTVLRAACRSLRKYWDREQTALSGDHQSGSAEIDVTRYWLDCAVQGLRAAADRYDRDPTVHDQAAASEKPFLVLFSGLSTDGHGDQCVAVLVSVLKAAATTMLHLFSETFGLAVVWGDYTILIRRVVLPLAECFLLTKALNPSWKRKFPSPGLLFSPRTMADPPHELEWREGERCPSPRGLHLTETKVVVFTTFPGIPARFGAAETVLHRAEVLVVSVLAHAPEPEPGLVPSAPCLAPRRRRADGTSPALASIASVSVPTPVPALSPATNMTQTDAAVIERLNSWVASCKGDMAALFANLYDLVAEPVLLNRPRYLVGKDSQWLRIDTAAGIITRFLDLFDHTLAKLQSDLNHEIKKAERRIALLRAEMALAIVDAPISDQLRAILAEHAADIVALDHPKIKLRSPRWQVPFVHIMYQWYRLVLVARMAGFAFVMPRAGDACMGQFACLAHDNARECGRTVGVALSPNVVRAADERRVLLCAGYCDRGVPLRLGGCNVGKRAS